MTLTQHLAEKLNKISLQTFDELCPDWIELMIHDGKIVDTKLNDKISINQEKL